MKLEAEILTLNEAVNSLALYKRLLQEEYKSYTRESLWAYEKIRREAFIKMDDSLHAARKKFYTYMDKVEAETGKMDFMAAYKSDEGKELDAAEELAKEQFKKDTKEAADKLAASEELALAHYNRNIERFWKGYINSKDLAELIELGNRGVTS